MSQNPDSVTLTLINKLSKLMTSACMIFTLQITCEHCEKHEVVSGGDWMIQEINRTSVVRKQESSL